MANVASAKRDAAAAVLLNLWAQEPDDSPGEHGQRSGTGALHRLARERMVGVVDVRRSQRHGDQRWNERAPRQAPAEHLASRRIALPARCTSPGDSFQASRAPQRTPRRTPRSVAALCPRESRRNAAAAAAAPTCRLEARMNSSSGKRSAGAVPACVHSSNESARSFVGREAPSTGSTVHRNAHASP